MRACEHWRVPKVKLDYAQAPLPTPTLLLAGERDYVTPVAWAQRVAEQLPNGRLLTAFLEAPDSKRLDTTCIGTMHPPPFAID
jgi:pimeloyl-ACP methyl ester carboxylesterase